MSEEKNTKIVIRNDAERKLKEVNYFSAVGIVALVIFGTIHLFLGNKFFVWLEYSMALIGALNIYLLYVSKNIKLSSSVILLLMNILYIILLFTGGISNTGVFWFFSWPLLAFFLKDKGGIVWVIGSILEIIFIGVLSSLELISIPYSAVQLSQLGASLLAVSLLAYFYWRVQDGYSVEMKERTMVLYQEIEVRKSLEASLEKSVRQANSSNEQLEMTKKAMLNLLEDLKEEKGILAKEQAKDEAILKSIGEGLVVMDASGAITFVNKVFESSLGISFEEARGNMFVDLVPMMENDKIVISSKRAIVQVFKKGKVVSYPGSTIQYYIRHDGSKLPVAITATPILENKMVVGAVVVFRDVTKEKEIDRAKTEFVSLASHQLRTPLTAINWLVEVLLAGNAGKISKKQHEILGQTKKSARRMAELVDSLLNVSRLELGVFMVEPMVLNLADIIDEVVVQEQQNIIKKEIKFKKMIKKIAPLPLDKKLIFMVIQNLLSNAIKYTPNKGSVTLAVKEEDKEIILSVTDTGYGIPEGQKDKIFSKLFRADNVRKRDFEGTGLGLYIVKQIMEQSGGRAWFESVENKGSVFYISIPKTGMKKKEGEKSLS